MHLKYHIHESCIHIMLFIITIICGKNEHPAYGFSPDPCPVSVPVGDSTLCDYKTHDLTEVKRPLEEKKDRNKVLQESSQLKQMRKELEVLDLRNAALEKRAVQDPQREATLKHQHTYCVFPSGTVHFSTRRQ